MLNHSSIAAMMLLFGGLLFAIISVKEQSIKNVQQVVQPMIGGSLEYNRMGPWPECEGMIADECESLIESIVDDNVMIIIVDADFIEKDVDINRVYIYAENEIVQGIPNRG